MLDGDAFRKSSFSFRIKPRKGGMKKGASLRAHFPWLPVQVVTVIATQWGHNCLSAENNNGTERRPTVTCAQSAAVSAGTGCVENSQKVVRPMIEAAAKKYAGEKNLPTNACKQS